MDADGRIIPWVEDDQGEGVKDPIDECGEELAELIESSETSPSIPTTSQRSTSSSSRENEFMKRLREPWRRK